MDGTHDLENTVERKEESARHALRAYRDRRRRRRDDDTYFGSTECFVERSEPEGPERERRRNELLADAEEANMSRDLADLLYDVAREEGLDPGLALELVRCGLGVCPPPDGLSNESAAPATDKYLPPWMFPATPPDNVIRERTLRTSLRRLRSLLETYHDVDEAFHRFANEPDVGHCGY